MTRILPAILLLALIPGRPHAEDVPAIEEAGPVAAPNGADHSNQFPDGERSQRNVGSCHAFTTVALLEAAYYRHYGKHKRFSEADVFVQNTLLTPDVYETFLEKGKPKLDEGKITKKDLEYALAHGVASSFAYKDFLKRYRRYRKAERTTLKTVKAAGAQEDEEEDYDPRADWVRLQQDPAARRILEAYLNGNRTGELAREREENRRAFEGFKLEVVEFEDFMGDASWGWEQSLVVKDELDAGRPVGFNVPGHVLVITGYHMSGDEPIFQTRDSDGSETLGLEDMALGIRAYFIREPARK